MSEESGSANLEKVDHIVVLMLENRSFDHTLGYLSLKGAAVHPDAPNARQARPGVGRRSKLSASTRATVNCVGHNERRVPKALIAVRGTGGHVQLWRIAAHLFEPSDSSAEAIVDDVLTMARAYAESMDLARTNDYLWRNAAAPVDVGDVDIMGVMIATSRRFGVGRVSEALSHHLEGASFVARAPLEMAMEYVQSEQ